MEEKLYFRPADYGKGLKSKSKNQKQSEKVRGDTDDSSESHRLRNFLIFVVIFIFVAAVILWLLRGKTTTSGQYPENVKNESLTCESKIITYEKTNNVNSDDKDLKISMVFAGIGSLSSASLKYTLRFQSYEAAHSAEAISHAQFNLALQALGYDASKFNNKFSILDNELVISLSLGSDKTLDDTTRSYFLVDYIKDDQLPRTLAEYKLNYEKQGFSCTSTIDNNK